MLTLFVDSSMQQVDICFCYNVLYLHLPRTRRYCRYYKGGINNGRTNNSAINRRLIINIIEEKTKIKLKSIHFFS